MQGKRVFSRVRPKCGTDAAFGVVKPFRRRYHCQHEYGTWTIVKTFDAKKMAAILRVLRAVGQPLGGVRVARELQALGLDLKPRTLRLYLEYLEKQQLVHSVGQRGRQITPRGIAELKKTSVVDRIGFAAAKVDALAYQTTFRMTSCSGRIVVNASIIDEVHVPSALREMAEVFRANLGMGRHVRLVRAGESIGDMHVPETKVVIATVCSVTLNGILLAAGIPVVSRFGGVLELQNGRPVCFTDVIHYDGTSLDPLEVFIKGGLTNVREAARTGNGRIGASFREIPSAAVPEVEKIVRKLDRIGLNGILLVGRKNQPLLDFPVQEGRTGMVVTGGLNAIAAVEEAGIPATNLPMHGFMEFDQLTPYESLVPSETDRHIPTSGG
jgi:repressor of nif and glnA expression